MSLMKDKIKFKVSEGNGMVHFEFDLTEIDSFGKDIAELVCEKVIGELTERFVKQIEPTIYNKVLAGININAVAQGVSLQIIQNMSQNPNKRDY